MDSEAVRERVRTLIVDVAPVRATAVAEESSLRLDLGYDSLTLLELAGMLEAEFGLSVAEDDYEVETVRDVEQIVLTRLAAAGAEEAGTGWRSLAT